MLPDDLSILHPRTRQILDYWRSLCRGDRLPGRRDLDLEPIRHLLPDIWLTDLVGPEKRARFRLVGTRVDKVMQDRLTGRWVDEVWPIDPEPLKDPTSRRHCVAVLKRPHFYRGPALYVFHPEVSGIEVIDLPLASDGCDVDMMLSHSIHFDREGKPYERTLMSLD